MTRLEKCGERFVEAPYEWYAPRVLPRITRLKDALEDRSRPLFMLRKRRSEPGARVNVRPTPRPRACATGAPWPASRASPTS
jgi:hypothetical protein